MSYEPYQPLVVESLHDLANKEFERIDPLIENLLPGVGTFLFCGNSKSGKSYLAFDLGMHVCKGEPFWGYDVRKTDVLYLCLEDGEPLLQDRMFTLTDEGPHNFYYSMRSASVETDLIRQLEDEMIVHPHIGLIIIDTLTAIRRNQIAVNGDANQNDYNIMRAFHEFSLQHNITLLVIHHLRKMRSEDPFDDISGTHGLYASSDGAFVLRKDKFSDDTAKLYSRCRDMEETVMTIRFDKATRKWSLIDSDNPMEDEFKTDPDLRKVIEYMDEHEEYLGSAAEFCKIIGSQKKPQSLSCKLFNRQRLLEKRGIYFDRTKTMSGSIFYLKKDKPETQEVCSQEDHDDYDDLTTFSG